MRGLLTSLVVFLLVCPAAHGWNAAGHKTTAAIAFELLKSDQRKPIIAILGQHPRFGEDFVAHMPAHVENGGSDTQEKWLLEQAAIWPDLVKRLDKTIQAEYNKGRWHYINMPVWLTDEDEAALTDKLSHNMATDFFPTMQSNLNVIQALRGNLEIWRDKSSTDGDKALALCWILHLTGDLHQPLHAVALFSRTYFPRGDRGGNSIKVVWGNGTQNLHAVWDGLPSSMEDLEPEDSTSQSIADDSVDEDVAIDYWLHENADLARQFVYTDDLKAQLRVRMDAKEPPTVNLSHEYLDSARSLARQQVKLAGQRIARLIIP
ncbi:MAG: S1/P1 nuclease [Woeseiaceae bacterium]|nr:S1/P1 nuclease [Woeseiaceae bacterium]